MLRKGNEALTSMSAADEASTRPSRTGATMDISTAIIEAAHILGNNRALTEHGTALGGLEAHSMKIAEAINGLSEQMGRIADALEESNRA
jgi:DNA-binding SARP family transcriptional activator